MCELLELELRRYDFAVTYAMSAADGLAIFESADFGAVLTDVRMAGQSGLDHCSQILARREDVPVIVTTAYADTETAIASIRAGAYDFVTKPFDMDELGLTLERALRHRSLREEVKRLRRAVSEAGEFDDILGSSDVMRRTFALVARLAESEATVLVSGESGTGKELVARALHARSARKDKPFVAINCAAMPESLLESELFGHVRGAFTDARTARQGLFIKANSGTLFLDEIGEMPAGMQAKLLRVLQERTVRPVGGEQEHAFDVRIVAATNRDLEAEVERGGFRRDLFYRLNVIELHLPPLRARPEDVPLLVEHFVKKHAAALGRTITAVDSDAADKLVSYPWPGNVRELQNCIEHAVALAPLDHLAVEDLPERIRDHQAKQAIELDAPGPTELMPMEEFERRYIIKVLEAVGGNKTMAAQVLGLDRRTLYRRLERGIETAPSPHRTTSTVQLRAVTPEDVRKANSSS
jgi:two-component system response regulator HydG